MAQVGNCTSFLNHNNENSLQQPRGIVGRIVIATKAQAPAPAHSRDTHI